jgi:DNA-binding transcriptional LysR family regulator
VARRISEFLDLYPDVRVELILTREDLDLAMREADVAIRLRRPHEADLIQRRLFTVHYHACASREYIKRFGEPQTAEDLENHRLITLSDDQPAHFLRIHRFLTRFPDLARPRQAHLCVNDANPCELPLCQVLGSAWCQTMPRRVILSSSKRCATMRRRHWTATSSMRKR